MRLTSWSGTFPLPEGKHLEGFNVGWITHLLNILQFVDGQIFILLFELFPCFNNNSSQFAFPLPGSLTHWGSAEEAHVKHDGVLRRERELSPGGVLPAVQHVAVRVGDLRSETVEGCKRVATFE